MALVGGSRNLYASAYNGRTMNCPVCGKPFFCTTAHAWKGKINSGHPVNVCSYTCQRVCEKKRERKRRHDKDTTIKPVRRPKKTVKQEQKVRERLTLARRMLDGRTKEINALKQDKSWLTLTPNQRKGLKDSQKYWSEKVETLESELAALHQQGSTQDGGQRLAG